MQIRTLLAACVISFAALVSVPATSQIREKIIVGGTEYYLATEPLERYFTAANPKPDLSRERLSSACERGYKGTWDIEGNKLRLLKITDCHGTKDLWQRYMKDREAPLIADWYTGVLRIEHGKMLVAVPLGYQSIHERDEYFVIVEGELKSRIVVTNDPAAIRVHMRVPASADPAASQDQPPAPTNANDGGVAWLDTLGLQEKVNRENSASGTIHVRGVFLGDRILLPGNGLESASRITLDLHDGAILPEVGAWVEAQVTLTENGRGELGQYRELREGEFLDRRGVVPVPKLIGPR